MNLFSQTINFIQWNENISSAGQPSCEQLSIAAQQGIVVVLNLGMPDANYALPDEQEFVENEGMEYIAIPVVWEKPALENYDEFSSAMKNQGDKKVFVHCYVNYRASVFVSLYRLQIGEISITKMYEEIARVWDLDDVWRNFIRQVIHQYGM